MSQITWGDPTWRIHDHIIDADGKKVFIFRRWGVEEDYWVRAEVFAGTRSTG